MSAQPTHLAPRALSAASALTLSRTLSLALSFTLSLALSAQGAFADIPPGDPQCFAVDNGLPCELSDGSGSGVCQDDFCVAAPAAGAPAGGEPAGGEPAAGEAAPPAAGAPAAGAPAAGAPAAGAQAPAKDTTAEEEGGCAQRGGRGGLALLLLALGALALRRRAA